MRADIHDGQEHNRSMQGPDTEAQDHPPFVHIGLVTHGRSIQTCHELAPAAHKSSARLFAIGQPEGGWLSCGLGRFRSRL